MSKLGIIKKSIWVLSAIFVIVLFRNDLPNMNLNNNGEVLGTSTKDLEQGIQVQDINIANVHPTGLSLWWKTYDKNNQPSQTYGSVVVTGTNSNNTLSPTEFFEKPHSTFYDKRGKDTKSSFHLVDIEGLTESTQYSILINSGKSLSVFETFGSNITKIDLFESPHVKTLIAGGFPLTYKQISLDIKACEMNQTCPSTILGQIQDSNKQMVKDAIVNLRFATGDKLSTWGSAIVGNNGKWIMDLNQIYFLNESCQRSQNCSSVNSLPETEDLRIETFEIVTINKTYKIDFEKMLDTTENEIDTGIIQIESEKIETPSVPNENEQEVCPKGKDCQSEVSISSKEEIKKYPTKYSLRVDTGIKFANVPVNIEITSSTGEVILNDIIPTIGTEGFVFVTSQEFEDGNYLIAIRPRNYTFQTATFEVANGAKAELSLREPFLPGNFNPLEDNEVNNKDLEVAKSYLQNSESNSNKDLDGNDEFDVNDLRLVSEIVLKGKE